MPSSLLSGHRFIAAIATVVALSGCANPPPADAQDTMPSREIALPDPGTLDAHIAEASQRFRLPEHWIRAVMQAESAGNARAVSHAGAMGLMQIMPRTWAELRRAHGFGSDPFDRRENVLAGAAYLRQMYDLFGAPGFLAAYNAGPGRYAEHVNTGRQLPRETRAYVAALSRELGFSDAAEVQTARSQAAPRWQAAPLFAPIPATPTPRPVLPSDDLIAQSQPAIDREEPSVVTERRNPLFAAKTLEEDR